MSWRTFKSQHTISFNKANVNYSCSKTLQATFFHRRLLAGKVFTDISWTEMAIYDSCAMLNKYIILMYLFK